MAVGGEEVRGLTRGQTPGQTPAVIKFQDVLVFLEQGDSTGGTDGSIVNHVAFRVPALTTVEAAGLKVARLNGFPGVPRTTPPKNSATSRSRNARTTRTSRKTAASTNAWPSRTN